MGRWNPVTRCIRNDPKRVVVRLIALAKEYRERDHVKEAEALESQANAIELQLHLQDLSHRNALAGETIEGAELAIKSAEEIARLDGWEEEPLLEESEEEDEWWT